MLLYPHFTSRDLIKELNKDFGAAWMIGTPVMPVTLRCIPLPWALKEGEALPGLRSLGTGRKMSAIPERSG